MPRLLDMPSRGLYALAAVTVVVVVACWFATRERDQEVARVEQAGRLIFPELHDQLDKITDIEVARAGGKFVLSRREGAWANMGVGGFPAIPVRVESMNTVMARLKYIAPRTRRNKSYGKLQVEDVIATAKSTRLTFRDGAGAVLADVIIGRQKDVLHQQSVYVRLPGDAQAWLAEGVFDVHHDVAGWSNRAVVDLDARSLNALTVSKPGGEVVVLRRNQPEDEKLELANLPAGVVVEHQYQIDYMTGLLQKLNFIDARRVDKKTSEATVAFEIEAHWKDHLVVILHADEPMPDGTAWARIDARLTDESQASDHEKREAARIQSTFSGWNVKLPRKFTERIKIRLGDIIKSGAAG